MLLLVEKGTVTAPPPPPLRVIVRILLRVTAGRDPACPPVSVALRGVSYSPFLPCFPTAPHAKLLCPFPAVSMRHIASALHLICATWWVSHQAPQGAPQHPQTQKQISREAVHSPPSPCSTGPSGLLVAPRFQLQQS